MQGLLLLKPNFRVKGRTGKVVWVFLKKLKYEVFLVLCQQKPNFPPLGL